MNIADVIRLMWLVSAITTMIWEYCSGIHGIRFPIMYGIVLIAFNLSIRLTKARKPAPEGSADWDQIKTKEVERLKMVRPKIVCLCGSSRFADVAAVKSWELSKQGIITVSYELLPDWYWKASGKVGTGHAAEQEGVAHILDELHLRKIDLADEIFVINVDGYIGERTRIEIDYAANKGKPVNYLMTNHPLKPTPEESGSKRNP